MKKTLLISFLALTMALPLLAGGALQTTDRSNPQPSPFADFFTIDVIGIRWDVRSLPVQYSLNTTFDPIPNPGGPAFLTLAEARPALQSTLDQWNAIPTSYVEMHITGTTDKAPLRGFDQINEITFGTAGGFTAIASSPSTSFVVDVNLPDGADIDGDGDSDVSSAITQATDVDGDGDIEMVAGSYPAGTIIDNDVQFNTKASNGFRFTVDDAQADTTTWSVDLECVAVHEFGHSFGLSHSMNNQNSATDGDGATMFPFIDTGDPVAELQQATIGIDDIAWASYFYPEGSSASGLAALQAGDVPFSDVFGLIQGEVTHGQLDTPVAGANVFVVNRQTGEMGPSGYSGTTRLLVHSSGQCCFFGNASTDIVDGKYVIPVPKGNWDVFIEPVDGAPVPATSISFTTQIGTRYGLMSFNEEAWNNDLENGIELRPGKGNNVHVDPGTVAENVDFVTNRTANVNPYGSRNFVGFTGTVPGYRYAVRIPASDLVIPGYAGTDYNLQSALFETFAWDASTTPVFAQALLTTGTVAADGSIVEINLSNPLERQVGFLGQDNDFAPLFVKNPHETGRRVRRGLQRGEFNSLFLVLQNPLTTPYPGVSGTPPLIGLDDPTTENEPPTLGQSYVSTDGVNWTQQARYNFRFSLVLSEP